MGLDILKEQKSKFKTHFQVQVEFKNSRHKYLHCCYKNTEFQKLRNG